MSIQPKSRLWMIFSLSMVVVMVLGACAPAVTPTPAPTNTAMPIPPTYTPIPIEKPAATATTAPTAPPKPTNTSAPSAVVNAFGVTLPADAAPLDQQFLRLQGPEGTTVDFANSVYKRSVNSYSDILSTPFVRLNKNFEIVPAGALKWEVTSDGKTWTFHMDPDLKWSDGNPVVADDVVFTFQYQADPKHAWDFAWFWSDIVNFSEAVAGKVPTSEIGVKKVDNYTVQFITTAASPYLPSKALYVRPLSKIAFEKSGEYYNNTPATSVSSTPYVLTDWTKGKGMSFGPNKNYTGKVKPFIERILFTFTQDNSGEFRAYQNGEVDMAGSFTPADIDLISKDPQLNKEYHPGYGDFRTHYLGFNTYEKPFSDLKVRQAFAKAIDRDSIIKNIVKRQGNPAYAFLMPGFPAANPDLKNEDVNKFDVAAAKKLLADAGYADGKGFPAIELWLRQDSDLNKAIAGAIASMLKQNLGIDVQVSNKETKLFMDALNAHTLQFYMVSYGFDYLDPSNMLGIWTSGGRHAWKNVEFDKLVTEATSLVGDDAKRDKEFKDAEKILVNDVGAVFVYHATPGNIYKPYMKGSELEPDKTGVAAWHWPNTESVGMLMYTLYVSKDVPASRK